MSIAEKLQIIAENEKKVYEAGKQAEYDVFWDVFQDGGNRTNYNTVFNEYWNETNFKPKYDIKIVGGGKEIFYNCKISDLEKILNNCGVTLDTSGMTTTETIFGGSSLKVLPVLDFSNVTSIYYTFNNCHTLHTIRKIILPKTAVDCSAYFFNNCYELTNVVFEGTLYRNFKAHAPKLSHDSLISLINALADYSGTSTTYTCSIGTTNLAKLTDEEKAIATQKGWTLA